MKCPGQDMKYWKESAIFDVECPKCKATVEFYKDDTSRKCGSCGHRFVNPKMDFGCAAYCPYAEQCIGALPEDFSGARDALLKDKVAVEMKRYLQTDFKRIREATTTAQFAENIGKAEGGNIAIILCAAYLHDIATPDAQAILQKVGANPGMVAALSGLLGKTDALTIDDSLEARILHDALTLRRLQEQQKDGHTPSTYAPLDDVQLFTNTAKTLAANLGKN